MRISWHMSKFGLISVVFLVTINCLSTRTWQDGVHIPEQVLYRDYICSAESAEKVYYLFWGLLALSDPAEKFNPDDKSLLLIKQDTTGFDIGFSIVMGTLFSMSSKTMNIERCIRARGGAGSMLPESLSPEARRRIEEAKRRREQNR